MFFYTISNKIRNDNMRMQMKQNLPDQVVDETSFLLPKGLATVDENDDKFVFVVPQRYVLGVMGFFAILNAYTMRVSLSIAITEMVDRPKNAFYDPDACIFDQIHNSSDAHNTVSQHLYPWTHQQQGLILSSFYWGYIITHIPGGVIAEKFGGKHVLGIGILCTSILTLLTPLVIYVTGGDWVWVVVLRVLEGFGEGTTFPALNAILSKWVPLGERSKLGTLVYAGSQIGTVLANSISGTLIHSTKSWASVFYFFGTMGCLWTFLWTILCYSDPNSHPFISDKEKNFLQEQMSSTRRETRTPWFAILTSVPVWALVVAQIGHDWGFFAMVTDLPTYLKEVLHYNVKENGFLSSIPYVVMWLVSMVAAYICDLLITKNFMSISFARKFFSTIGSLGPAIFLLLASYVGCDRTMAIVMFTIGMGCMGCFYCGIKVNILDLTSHYAGTVMAIVNGIGSLSGILVPYLISALTENHTLLQWRNVFWLTFAVLLITDLVFIVFGSAEVQAFDAVRDREENSET